MRIYKHGTSLPTRVFQSYLSLMIPHKPLTNNGVYKMPGSFFVVLATYEKKNGRDDKKIMISKSAKDGINWVT